MFLNGTAMSGQKDHGAHAGSTFLGPARTAAQYHLFVVRDEFPGLYSVLTDGRSIDGELYDIPADILHERLMPAEPEELELGEIQLLDGSTVHAMLLMPSRIRPKDKVVDVSELGGFRAYQRFLSDNRGISMVRHGDPSVPIVR
jgi:gamma-glutamylcyclotransferase (GGCT)/AIG2-like uncharacterized protein YtfP